MICDLPFGLEQCTTRSMLQSVGRNDLHLKQAPTKNGGEGEEEKGHVQNQSDEERSRT